MSTQIIQFFLKMRNTMKVYHWLTLSYPRHKATDDLVGGVDKISDKFVEVYIGRYGREVNPNKNLKAGALPLSLPYLNEKDVVAYLVEARTWLSEELPPLLNKSDTDLFNIRDELLAAINQCLYLFTLS